MPPYVYLGDTNHVGGPGFLGEAHQAYIPGNRGAVNLGLAPSMTLERLADRRRLLARPSTRCSANWTMPAAAWPAWTPTPPRRWR